MKKLLFFSLILLLSGACGSSKKTNSQSISFVMIAFGESGGATGTNEQYGLSSTGLLLQTPDDEAEPEMLRQVSDEELSKISRLAAKARRIGNFKQQPGNLNRKILIRTADGYHNYSWQMPEDTIPADVVNLYHALSDLVQNPATETQ